MVAGALLVLGLDWATSAHLRRAIESHIRWCRTQRIPVPDGLHDLARSIEASSGQQRPDDPPGPELPDTAHVLLTYDEAGALFGLSGRSVRRLVTSGRLHAVTVGSGARRIHRDDAVAFADGLRGQG